MRRFIGFLAVSAALVVSTGIANSVQAAGFVEFEGIDGEALDKHHQGQIDILAWSASGEGDPAEPSRAPRSRDANTNDVVLIQCREASRAELVERCVQAARFEMHQRTPQTHYPLGRINR
jgi:hypothetical protein